MKNNAKPNQRGSALLLTLGILSLVLILAMSFAFSARTNRQVAKVNADQIKAKLLAETGFERIMAAMKYNYDGSETGDIYPSGKVAGKRLLDEQVEGSKYYASFSSGDKYQITKQDKRDMPILDYPLSEDIVWQSVSVNDGLNDEVIGRIAFIIVEEADKHDINQMLSLSTRIPFVIDGEERLAPFTSAVAATNHFFYDIVGDGTYTSLPGDEDTYENQTVRLGLQMQELRADKKYFKELPQGFAGTKTRWFSYSHLWKTLWGKSLPNSNEADRYTFFSGEDIEAYWDGSNEWQRFDVTGYEWRTTTGSIYIEDPPGSDYYFPDPEKSGWHHNGTLDDARDLVDHLVDSNNIVDTSDLSLYSSAIEYLNTMPDPKQVAANMIDFCDEDNGATYAPSGFGLNSNSEPDYCGNEGVLYFNEIVVKFVAYKYYNIITDKYEYKLEFVLYPEMLNVFNEVKPQGRVRIRLNCQAQINIANVGYDYLLNHDTSKAFDFTWDLPSNDESNPGFKLLSPKNEVLDERSYDIDHVIFYKINIQTIVMISDDGTDEGIYDIGFHMPPAVSEVEIEANEASGNPQCVSWEVADPRFNHKSDSWLMKICNTGEDETFYPDPAAPTDVYPSLGKTNKHFLDSCTGSNMDLEDYDNFDFNAPDKTFSTAFIPNRPFRSLWELGAIHRGEPFRTIDIAAADSEILDQVKIGPLKRTKGKFNLYSSNPVAIEILLGNIDVKKFYDNIDKNEIGTLTNVPASLSSPPSYSRGVFAEILEYSAGDNDREREALIGRTANLLTTRMDKYSILVVAQSLQELKGVTFSQVEKTAINPIEYNSKVFSILATQRLLAHVVRDAWHNEYKIVQMQLLED